MFDNETGLQIKSKGNYIRQLVEIDNEQMVSTIERQRVESTSESTNTDREQVLKQNFAKMGIEIPDCMFSDTSRDPPGIIRKDHPTSQINGEVCEKIHTRNKSFISYEDMVRFACFSSTYCSSSQVSFVLH